MKKIIPIFVGCITAIFLLTECKSPAVISETVKDDEIEESVSAYRQVIVEVQPTNEEAEPITEVIVEVQPSTEQIQPIAEAVQTPDPGIHRTIEYYSVQVGAFIEPLNAEEALRKIRQRFDLEASNDYDPVEQLYKITIGTFTLYEDAQMFRDRIMRDYPGQYIDAWIVDMARRKHKTIQ